MKKILVLLIAGLMAMSVTACKEDSGSDDTSGNSTTSSSTSDSDSKDSDKESDKSKNDSSEITMEAVLNHAVSPDADFIFSLDDEGVNGGIMSYTGTDSIVVTPDTYDGAPVTKIEKYSFSKKNSEKAIRFADSVVEIDELACSLNEGIEIVVLGANTKTIHPGVFLECPALREVKLNDGLETISRQAFAKCYELKSITIPESVTTIEPGAFFSLEKTLVIHGKAGSAAEEFAKTEGIQFVAE
ncbi:MAG: leucine-rich repeat domain-containing protein [Acutalibacteraceae bacterium]|nr:leucine-rich repeat domain-containing protein [Acutalibacteraceae bacterium]